MEGEEDIFISCPFYGEYVPIWEINGKLFELFQVPVNEQIIPASRGLLIPIVNLAMKGTTFQCFYPTGDNFEVKSSSHAVLTVTPMSNSKINNNNMKNLCSLPYNIINFLFYSCRYGLHTEKNNSI